jgi:hypothetical protein
LPILIRFLMLMACGPLLLPSGVCVCHAGERVRATTSEAAPVEVAKKPARCCQRCPSEVENPSVTSPPTEQHPTSPPTDGPHAPGCPASLSVDRVQQGVTAEQFVLTSPVVVWVISPVAVRGHDGSPVVPSVCRLSSPLYLSHCSLVI